MKLRPASKAVLLSLLLGSFMAVPSDADDWLAECNIKFENEFALTWLYTNARATFAVHTGLADDGTQPCDPSNIACWTYRERCGSRGYVNVEEAPLGTYNHIHLTFENDELAAASCFVDPDGEGAGFGYGTPSDCTPADWKTEPRFVAGHTPDHVIKVWIEDHVTHESRTFGVASIRVLGPMNAEVWFQNADGSWWYWPSLAPKKWDLREYTSDIRALYVKAAEGSVTSVAFDNVVVRN